MARDSETDERRKVVKRAWDPQCDSVAALRLNHHLISVRERRVSSVSYKQHTLMMCSCLRWWAAALA